MTNLISSLRTIAGGTIGGVPWPGYGRQDIGLRRIELISQNRDNSSGVRL